MQTNKFREQHKFVNEVELSEIQRQQLYSIGNFELQTIFSHQFAIQKMNTAYTLQKYFNKLGQLMAVRVI